MKTLNEYQTPETDNHHEAFNDNGNGISCDDIIAAYQLARNLEQRLALCRDALAWIAKLYDDSQPIYKVAMDAYAMKSEAATALSATKLKP